MSAQLAAWLPLVVSLALLVQAAGLAVTLYTLHQVARSLRKIRMDLELIRANQRKLAKLPE